MLASLVDTSQLVMECPITKNKTDFSLTVFVDDVGKRLVDGPSETYQGGQLLSRADAAAKSFASTT